METHAQKHTAMLGRMEARQTGRPAGERKQEIFALCIGVHERDSISERGEL
jgi:hypothetical protein